MPPMTSTRLTTDSTARVFGPKMPPEESCPADHLCANLRWAFFFRVAGNRGLDVDLGETGVGCGSGAACGLGA